MRSSSSRLAVLVAICLAAGVGYGQYLETTIRVGDTPVDILWNPTSNKVYCSNEQSSSVSVIDGATNAVRATIVVGEYPTRFGWNSIENKVYCASGEVNRVAVIDGDGDSLISLVHLSGYPHDFAFCTSLNKLYVPCYDDNVIRVLDAHSDTVVATVRTPTAPFLPVWHPVSNRVFCVSSVWPPPDSIYVIDCATDRVVHVLPVADNVSAMLVNPLDSLMYVTCSDTTYVLSPGGDSIVARIPVTGYAPWSACLAPYPNKLYVGDFNSGLVSVVDCATRTVICSLRCGLQIYAALCDTVNAKVYLSTMYAAGYPGVTIVDAQTDIVLDSLPLGPHVGYMAWNPIYRRVYVVDETRNRVYVVRDTSTGVVESPGSPTGRHILFASVTRTWFHWLGSRDAVLIDAGGRRVLKLTPGRNYVGRLPAGVYFAQVTGGRVEAKVVIPAARWRTGPRQCVVIRRDRRMQ